MKIYTKTGDNGDTGLYRGGRVAKDSLRIRACGEVDELNSLLGWVRTLDLPSETDRLLAQVQNDLFVIGADISTPEEAVSAKDKVLRLPVGGESFLEKEIDQLDHHLPPLKQFILPGGSKAAAALHLARSVCRRAEREVVSLARSEAINSAIVVYLNRLSDFLFTQAREMNRVTGVPDVPWRTETEGGTDE